MQKMDVHPYEQLLQIRRDRLKSRGLDKFVSDSDHIDASSYEEKPESVEGFYYDPNNGYRCAKCNFFTSSYSYECKTHIRKCTGMYPNYICCQLCHTSIICERDLLEHLDSHVCEDIKARICEICDKVFLTSESTKKHKQLHGNLNKCLQCLRVFPWNRELIDHRSLHKGDLYECPICEKKFSKFIVFQHHLNDHHQEGSFKCEICDDLFLGSRELVDHVMTHFGVKSYSSMESCKPMDLLS